MLLVCLYMGKGLKCTDNEKLVRPVLELTVRAALRVYKATCLLCGCHKADPCWEVDFQVAGGSLFTLDLWCVERRAFSRSCCTIFFNLSCCLSCCTYGSKFPNRADGLLKPFEVMGMYPSPCLPWPEFELTPPPPGVWELSGSPCIIVICAFALRIHVQLPYLRAFCGMLV